MPVELPFEYAQRSRDLPWDKLAAANPHDIATFRREMERRDRDLEDFLARPSGAIYAYIRASGIDLVTAEVETPIEYDRAVFDYGNIYLSWYEGTDPERITVLKDATYRVLAGAYVQSELANETTVSIWPVDGGDVAYGEGQARHYAPIDSTGYALVSLMPHTLFPMVAGSWFETRVTCTADCSANVWMAVEYAGPYIEPAAPAS